MTEMEIRKTLSYARSKQLIVRIELKTGKVHKGRPMDIEMSGASGFCCNLDIGGAEIKIPIEAILNVNQ